MEACHFGKIIDHAVREGGDFFGTGKINRQGLGRFITDYEIQDY